MRWACRSGIFLNIHGCLPEKALCLRNSTGLLVEKNEEELSRILTIVKVMK